jgi:transposase-like protein
MDERVKFIAMYLRGEHALSELCQHFGVSRKMAYKWLQRYAGGPDQVDDSLRHRQKCRLHPQRRGT